MNVKMNFIGRCYDFLVNDERAVCLPLPINSSSVMPKTERALIAAGSICFFM